jgi:hypothetical protein
MLQKPHMACNCDQVLAGSLEVWLGWGCCKLSVTYTNMKKSVLWEAHATRQQVDYESEEGLRSSC